MKQLIISALLISFAISGFSSGKGKIEVPLRFDRYYNYDEVNEALKVLNKAYPELTKLDVVGKSEEGREIYALTINNPKTGSELEKPTLVFLGCNFHLFTPFFPAWCMGIGSKTTRSGFDLSGSHSDRPYSGNCFPGWLNNTAGDPAKIE